MPKPPRTSVYHCGECEQETDVDGAGVCPVTGGAHVVDLVFHHRHAHDTSDPDPDCSLCEQDARSSQEGP